MNKWWYVSIFMAFVGAVMCLLYCRGIAVSKCIAAILFVFCPGKSADKASLDSCTGWVRHAGRFRESRTYEFVFDARLTKGDAEVFLQDKKKRTLLKLDRESPNGRIELEEKNRYYLRWEFRNATGKCELRW